MSSDGSPILIDLLDSLSSINKRLNLIETALSIQEVDDGLVDAGAGNFQAPSHPQPHWHPPVPDKSPQAVARRYDQPPSPPYQPYAQSITPLASSINPPPPTDYNQNHTYNATAATSAGWPSTRHAGTPATSKQQRPYTKRSSQLLRLQNVHVKDTISDDGTEYKVDTGNGDVYMKNSEEGAARGAEDMAFEPAVKQEKHGDNLAEPRVFGQQQPILDVAKQLQPGQSAPNNNNPAPAPPVAEETRLEALPEGFIVTGRATLQEELDGWTIPRGYSMRINGTRSHGRQQKIRMVCFRGGRSRLRPKEEEQEEERQRKELDREKNREKDREKKSQLALGGGGGGEPPMPVTLVSRRRKPTTDRISKKCECPFRFELVEVCPGADEYAVHYTNDDHTQHNHAAADLMLDPRARKLPSALKAEVDQWLCGNARDTAGRSDRSDRTGKVWTIAAIQAELQKRGYGHVLDFDLRNRKRALLHKERLAQQNGGGGESSKAGSTGSVGESSAGNTPTAS